jgi:hypothetical protein
MKVFKQVIMLVMLLNLTACSESKVKEERGEEKMQEPIRQERPFYMIEAEGMDSGIEIYLNDVSIYHDYSAGSYGAQTFVNDFVKDGLNKLRIELMGKSKENFNLDPQTHCKVSFVKNVRGEKSVISTIVYNRKAKERTQGTREEGFYDSNRSYERSNRGDTLISSLEVKPYNSFGKDKGIYLEQNISIEEKAFPLWKFLSSEDIIDKSLQYMSSEKRKAFRESKKGQALYKVYGELHDALKRKDVDFVIELMKERNEELDLAYFKTKGHTEKEMREDLEEMVNNSKFELLEYVPSKHYTYMDESLKLMYLKTLIYNRKAPDEGSIKYPMMFRYENGKWILTR